MDVKGWTHRGFINSEETLTTAVLLPCITRTSPDPGSGSFARRVCPRQTLCDDRCQGPSVWVQGPATFWIPCRRCDAQWSDAPLPFPRGMQDAQPEFLPLHIYQYLILSSTCIGIVGVYPCNPVLDTLTSWFPSIFYSSSLPPPFKLTFIQCLPVCKAPFKHLSLILKAVLCVEIFICSVF